MLFISGGLSPIANSSPTGKPKDSEHFLYYQILCHVLSPE